ncbi:TPA: hypothetical protein DDW35_01705 [Candidatus Sumerlaeota bacterium]|nr:hypothetical protein [Candidatus Sumerlaeota bacterium]
MKNTDSSSISKFSSGRCEAVGKRRLLFPAILLLLLFWTMSIGASWAQLAKGAGTTDDPYQITTVAELQWINTCINYKGDTQTSNTSAINFKLMNNIEITAADDVALGNSKYWFKGTFLGNNRTIYGVRQPLFSYFNGTIEYLTLSSNAMDGTAGTCTDALFAEYSKGAIKNSVARGVISGSSYVGSFIGWCTGGSLTECSYYSTVTAVEGLAVSGSSYYVGGLIGYNSGGIITQCSVGSATDVTTRVSGTDYVGGFAGYNTGSMGVGTYGGNSFSGAVSGVDYVGGFAGYNTAAITGNASVYNRFSGVVSGGRYVGGLAGYNSGGSYSYSTVSGAAISGSDDYVGGVVGGNHGATTFNYCSVSAPVLGDSYYVGGILGYNDLNGSCTFSYCSTSGAVAGGYSGVGGLLGYSVTGCTVTECSTSGDVTSAYGGYVGGLVGIIDTSTGTASFGNSIASGDVSGLGGYVGGLVGAAWDIGTMNLCDAYGDVTGLTCVGGLVGYDLNGGTYTEVYYSGDAVTATGGVDEGLYVGGLVGKIYNGSMTDCGVSAVAVSGYDDVGGLIGYNWACGVTEFSVNVTKISGHQNIGGVVGYNYEASLQGTLDTASSVYYTSADIHGEVFGTGNYVGGVAGYNDGASTVKYCMVGSIDEKYTPVVVTGYGNWVGGVFGANNGGSIDQCNVTVEVFGICSGGTAVGGLIGESSNGGTITKSYVSAQPVYALGTCVGGLVGLNASAISDCFVVGDVSGVDKVGGLVGDNYVTPYGTGAVSTSFSQADVVGDGSYVGGLAGHNRMGASIANCYATGAVAGSAYVGGGVGCVGTPNSAGTVLDDGSTVAYSYAIGAVTGDSHVGGMIGYTPTTSTLTNVVWNKETTGQTTSSGGGRGATTAQMQDATQATTIYSGWGVGTDGTWVMSSYFNFDGYPYLFNMGSFGIRTSPAFGALSYYINKGAETTTNPTVTLDTSYTGAPGWYKAAETTETLQAKVWTRYSTSGHNIVAPTWTLSAGDGVKTIYYLIKDENEQVLPLLRDTIKLTEGITLSAFALNGGSTPDVTTSQTVSLVNTHAGRPTYYQVSESSTFAGASWLPYPSSGYPSYVLSAGNGTKTVYFRLSTDSVGSIVSSTASDTITFTGPVVTKFNINNGASVATNLSVTLYSTCTGSPDLYKASEQSDFSDVSSWSTYDGSALSFTLSGGDASKKVYFKVKNSSTGQESVAVSDSITLSQVVAESLSINGGATETENRTITLISSISGQAQWYQASESKTFAGARWSEYGSTDKHTLQLSAKNGLKTVYFRFKNYAGHISNQISAPITLNMPVVSSLKINEGATSTTSRIVTLDNIADTGSTPTSYMASESATFVGASWLPYALGPKFELSANNGTKTVYFKVRNTLDDTSEYNAYPYHEESVVVKDTIVYNGPVVKSLSINAGAVSTTTRTVTLKNACTGGPTAYAASEDSLFSGVTSTTYSASVAPAFTITSTGDGIKTIYFKVWNANNQASEYKTDTIVLDELSLTTVTVASTYGSDTGTTVSTRSVTLPNTYAAGSGYTTTKGKFVSSAPISYMASESATFKGAGWKTYSSAPAFTLSANTGDPASKTVYFKLKNVAGQTSTLSSSVILDVPILKSVAINDGASSVSVSAVTLTPSITGTVSAYMVSESSTFSVKGVSASWIDGYAGLPVSYSFASATAGTKRVYFKVKNAAGTVSTVVNDTIKKSGNSATAPTPVKASSTSSSSKKTSKTGTTNSGGTTTDSATTGVATDATKTNVTTTNTLSLSAGALDFGTVALGAAAQQTIILTNNTNAALTISGITYPDGFTGDWTGGTLAVGASQSVVVTFAPSAEASYSGSVAVASDKPAVSVAVQGVGAKPVLKITDYALSATNVKEGDPFVATLTISNESDFATGKFHVALYLLTDDTLLLGIGAGYLVEEVAVDSIAAQDEALATWNFAVPALGDASTYSIWPVFALEDSQSVITTFDVTKNMLQSTSVVTVAK